jgi:hypothetical protein
MEMEEKHIVNLKILLDRYKLLELLPKNAIAAEIGVDEGIFSKRLILSTKPKKLHLIDSWASDRFSESKLDSIKKRFRGQIESGIIVINRGDSLEELGKFEDHYFDWVYLDTTHDYKSTKLELKLLERKVKKDGIIAGHDYTDGNVITGYRYGIVDAVNEFCVKNDWEMIYLTHESNRYLTYALRKIC